MAGSSQDSLPGLPGKCLTLEDEGNHGNEQTVLLNDLPENTEVVESWENLQEVRTISSLPNGKIRFFVLIHIQSCCRRQIRWDSIYEI